MTIEILRENFQRKEGTFYYELNDRSNFDVGLYNQFVYLLIHSFNSIENDDVRCKLSLEMWELFFLISKDLISHQNKLDLYKIKGIDEELISNVVNNLYEIGNFISWKKELNFKDYLLD